MEVSPMVKDSITISCSEYEYLLERDNKLSTLEAYGVDNWCGYDDAMSELDNEEE